jgi:hypothetical protein
MTSLSLQTPDSAPQAMPVAMAFSTQLLLTQESSETVKSSSADNPTEAFRIRRTELTELLKNITGYTHGGLND